MLTLCANKIAKMPINEVWDTLAGRFMLKFDDGVIETNAKETIYSRHFWEFHNENPGNPLLTRHHVKGVLNGKRAGMSTHLNLINQILWDIYDNYVNHLESTSKATLNLAIHNRILLEYRYKLAETAYEITNLLYNEAVDRLGSYVLSIDAFDFLEVFDSKEIQEAYDKAAPNEVWIDYMNSTIDNFLNEDPKIRNNTLSKVYRSGIVNKQQVQQSIGVRGYVDGIDNIRFEYPVMRGYFQGIRSAHDYIVEPQTAVMSLNAAKAPLQETEYFSRKLQIMCMVLERLHHCDCGSNRYIKVFVRPKTATYKGDLSEMAGKNYIDEDGVMRQIKLTDKHLEGKTISIRSVIFCKHPDPRGVCSVCYGGLSEQIPFGSNFGHINGVYMTEQHGQGVLSTRHSAKSTSLAAVEIDQDVRAFLKAGVDNNSYAFTDSVKNKAKAGLVKLYILTADAPNIADIQKVERINEIAITRFSEIELCILNIDGIDIALEVGSVKRKSSITHDMLHYINKIGITKVDNDKLLEIDLKDWDFTKSFVSLPLRNFSMADHSKEIAAILESSVTEAMERDRYAQPAAVLLELFSLVNNNGRLSVNLAVLEVVLYCAMIRSAEHYDYALPKPHTENGLGVLRNVLMYRSAAAYMAYERHLDFINAPESYLITNRMDHPFDFIIGPNEVKSKSNRVR